MAPRPAPPNKRNATAADKRNVFGMPVHRAVLLGAGAIIPLLAGGLKGMQSAATIAGLPFALILLLMCASLYMGLRNHLREQARVSDQTR